MYSLNMHNDGDNFSIIANNSFVKVEMQMVYLHFYITYIYFTLISRHDLNMMAIAGFKKSTLKSFYIVVKSQITTFK